MGKVSQLQIAKWLLYLSITLFNALKMIMRSVKMLLVSFLNLKTMIMLARGNDMRRKIIENAVMIMILLSFGRELKDARERFLF